MKSLRNLSYSLCALFFLAPIHSGALVMPSPAVGPCLPCQFKFKIMDIKSGNIRFAVARFAPSLEKKLVELLQFLDLLTWMDPQVVNL